MKNFIYLITISLLISCKQNELPLHSHIITKYIVFDENITPKLNVCEDTIKSFKDSTSYGCIFKLNEKIFEIEYAVTINEEGHMVKYESHSVNDNIEYKKLNIQPDMWSTQNLNGRDFWIRLSEARDKIIDGKDTMDIEDVFENEKLVFVKSKGAKKGRKFIYRYQ